MGVVLAVVLGAAEGSGDPPDCSSPLQAASAASEAPAPPRSSTRLVARTSMGRGVGCEPWAWRTSTPSRPPRSTSCGRCRPSGCGRRSSTPTRTSRTTARPGTPPACTPTTSASSPTWRSCRSRRKADLRANYPFGMFAVPREQVVRVHASSGTTGQPTVVGYTAEDVDMWATVMARSIRAAGGRPGRRAAQRLRLRPVHRRPRRPLRRREARLHRRPRLGRHDRAAGPADHRLRSADHHGHAVVHARDRRRDAPPGPRPAGVVAARSASSAPSRGPTRCAARWRRSSASTRSTSTGSRR